jgi:hypothetical protein
MKKYHSSFLDEMKDSNENLSQQSRHFGRDFITASPVHKTETEVSLNRSLGDRAFDSILLRLIIATQIIRT